MTFEQWKPDNNDGPVFMDRFAGLTVFLFTTLIDFSFSLFLSKKKFTRLRAKVISALIPLRNEKNFLTRWKTHSLSPLFHTRTTHTHTYNTQTHTHTHAQHTHAQNTHTYNTHTHNTDSHWNTYTNSRKREESELSTSSEYVYLLIGTFCPVERSDKLSDQ